MSTSEDNTESKNGIKESNSTSKIVQEAVASLNAEKSWPGEVVLYTALQEQELLTDVARCYVVQALLTVHGLTDSYKIQRRHNAEFMVPNDGRRLPFLRTPKRLVAQEDILDFMFSKSYVLKYDLTAEENMVMQGVISLIETKLTPIEYYCIWVDPVNKKNTLERYGYNYPLPLKNILCWRKDTEVQRYLKTIGIFEKSEEEIKGELCSIYECIAKKLEINRYIIGNDMTEADVYVYGHLQAILELKLDNNILVQALEDFPRLTNFCLNFNQFHLGNKAMIWEFL